MRKDSPIIDVAFWVVTAVALTLAMYWVLTMRPQSRYVQADIDAMMSGYIGTDHRTGDSR